MNTVLGINPGLTYYSRAIEPNSQPDGSRLRVMLVYQAGIANVYIVDCFNLAPFGRNARIINQGDFRGCELIAYGCGMVGAIVRTAACNRAGDISGETWTDDLESQPFSDKFNPVFFTLGLAE